MSEASIARKFSAAGIFCLSIFTLNAKAALLLPGGGIPTPPEPNGLGTLVAGGIPVAFASALPNGFSGTLQSSVIQEAPGQNPLNGLTFVYQLHNNGTSATALERLTLADFSGFATDVSYLPATGTAPSVVDRSFGTGAVIGWDFTGLPVGLGTLLPGQNSALLVVQTNAQFYNLLDSASIIDGKTVNTVAAAPNDFTNVSPEPASLLSVVGFTLLALRRRSA